MSIDPLAGFSRNQSDGRTAQTRALKDLVRRELGLDAETSVLVAEIACGEVDCPDRETVIAVLRQGARQEYRVAKALVDVTGADLSGLLAQQPTGDEPSGAKP